MKLLIFSVVASCSLAGAAHAQTAMPAPASPPMAAPPAPPEFRGPDERLSDLNRLRDEALRAGPTKSVRPVPVTPEDIVAGREVLDSKGVLLGQVERVGTGYAVVASPGGKIEVAFDSFAKNNKGLLINMRKSKFDAIVAGTAKPGK